MFSTIVVCVCDPVLAGNRNSYLPFGAYCMRCGALLAAHVGARKEWGAVSLSTTYLVTFNRNSMVIRQYYVLNIIIVDSFRRLLTVYTEYIDVQQLSTVFAVMKITTELSIVVVI